MKKSHCIVLFAFIIIFTTSCNKEYDPLGLGMKDRDLLGYSFIDSSSVVAYSLLEDSTIITNMSTNKYANNAVLGDLNDPVFGRTRTNMYAQFNLSASNVSFGNAPTLDSIVLTLALTGEYYGDTNSRLNIQVYELSESLTKDGKYYTNQTTETYSENLTYDPSFVYTPTPRTPIKIDTVRNASHIRIRLKDELGHNFMSNSDKMSSTDVFLSFFKGLYVVATTTSPTGCLLSVNLRSPLSTITLYFTVDNKSQKHNFPSAGGVNYCSFVHDYTTSLNTNFKDQVLNGMKERGERELYIQPLFGVKTFVLFPHIASTFKDQKVVINKAELVLTNLETDLRFPNSAKLSLQAIRENGAVSFIPDDPFYTGDKYSGTYLSNKKEYRFIVTQYVQQLIQKGEPDLGLYIVTTGAAIRGNRVVFSGTAPENAGQRLRLEIHYTSY